MRNFSVILIRLLLTIVLCYWNTVSSSEFNITIVLEHGKIYSIKINKNNLAQYPILVLFKNSNAIKKFQSDNYYLNYLKALINSIKFYNNNKNYYKFSKCIKYNTLYNNEILNITKNEIAKSQKINKSNNNIQLNQLTTSTNTIDNNNFLHLFALIFDDIIIKIIRTYRFIFNNIEYKLFKFYDKYYNKLYVNNYISNNKKLDEIYKEIENILLQQ